MTEPATPRIILRLVGDVLKITWDGPGMVEIVHGQVGRTLGNSTSNFGAHLSNIRGHRDYTDRSRLH